jgi:methylation protein EvaC
MADLCRVCSHSIRPFMSFGKMPIANGFLTPEEVSSEYFFELQPAFCASCGMFQIVDQPAAEKMFHGSYAFYSSTSRYMQEHFRQFAEHAKARALAGRPDPLVVELGSNDGIMLRHFHSAGIRHLGIEPSENVAEVARKQGIPTISEFFNEALSERIVAESGRADAVLAANVMCHIPALPSVIAGIRNLLKPDGILMFEDPYLGDMITKTSYDQIYDEHVFIFSATSISRAFETHGMELIDLMPQTTHGGSMRYVLARKGSHPVSTNVANILAAEKRKGLDDSKTYDVFRKNCEASRDALVRVIESLRDEGKRIVGYGATSKSTTITNYCGLGPSHIEFISDTTPIKQGKLSPGTHIPVKSHESFSSAYPDFAVLFAWNHATEILEKEQAFAASGGKWIAFVPRVEVMG